MSIILLHGGGLSKTQLDSLSLRPKGLRLALLNWAFGFYRRYHCKD